MPEFFERIEVREISPTFIVVKSWRAVPDRLRHALIESPYVRKSVLRSARRLEIELADPHYSQERVVQLLVNGHLLARAPGEDGFDVTVEFMTSHLCDHGLANYYTVNRTETYKRFATTSEWMSVQHTLFGRLWADGHYN